MGKPMKDPRNLCMAAVLLLCLLGPGRALAVTGPNPAPRVLLLYSPANWNGTMERDNMLNMLTTTIVPAPVVDSCPVNDPGGEIAPALAACGTSLSNYCQVYDLRFVFNTSGGPYEDSMTANDQALFTQFLQDGGRLFLLGETSAFHPRNDGFVNLINQLSNAGTVSYPTTCNANCCCSVFPSDPLNFNTVPNTLTGLTINTGDPGLFAFGQMGSGRPLATKAGVGAMTVGFLPQDLTTGAGRLMIHMDSNFFRYAVGSWPAANVAFMQNAYNWLGSGCDQRYRLTKAASVLPPATVCLGDNFNYTLCVENVGPNPLTAATIFDTLPTCLGYVSSSLAPAVNSGGYLVWNVGAVPVGGQVCVTATVNAVSLPPCP